MKTTSILRNLQEPFISFLKILNSYWHRFSIRKKIFISYLVIIVALVFFIDILILSYQEQTLRKEIYNRIHSRLSAFAYEIIDYVVFLDPLKLDEKISVLIKNPGIKYIMIADLNGRIIAHSNHKKLGSYIKIKPDTFTYWERDSGNIKIINLPIFKKDYPLGVIRVGISERSINNYIKKSFKKLKNYIFLISAGVLLLTLYLSYILSNTLTKPLSTLKEKMANLRTEQPELCENKNLIVCKDFYKCDETTCPAYGKTRCWLIPEARKICKKRYNIDCHECFVYKISCGDEIGYLIETFNEMIVRLKHYLVELERSNREKLKLEKSSAVAEMAMVVAHEVKNPLNAIKAASSYLKANFKGKVLTEFLSIIDKEVERLNELITGFLSYARPIPLKLEKNDINVILKEVVRLVQPEIEEDGKILKAEFDPTIPEFYFDSSQIKQAVLNLLLNAEDATKEGDIILLKTEKQGNQVVITVKDTGIGISENELDRIFEPFFTTKINGSGLGLACVERIIREHCGKIEVKSKLGEGTEFIIRLPIRDEV